MEEFQTGIHQTRVDWLVGNFLTKFVPNAAEVLIH